MEMNVTKLARIASLLAFLFAACLIHSPARAQFGGFGGGGDGDMMTTMAPMLGTMKKKMGKKRFTQLMQTMGPMMEKMGGEGGFGGFDGGFDLNSFGGGFGDLGGMEQLVSSDMLSGIVGLAMSSGSHRKGRKARRHH